MVVLISTARNWVMCWMDLSDYLAGLSTQRGGLVGRCHRVDFQEGSNSAKEPLMPQESGRHGPLQLQSIFLWYCGKGMMVLLSIDAALIGAQAALKESDLGRVMCRDILKRNTTLLSYLDL